jgi:tRNA-binding protein
MKEITWKDFEQVELRVGEILKAEVFPEARKPAYKLEVDFGEEIGVLKSSAQITHHYTPEELIGRQVIGVVNFPPKQIGPIMSQCLITGFYDQNGEVILAVPDKLVQKGKKLS